MVDAVVDACCVLNLAAAGGGDLDAMLAQLGYRFHIPRIVLIEPRVLWKIVDDERIDLLVDIETSIDAGRIIPCELDSPEELELFVRVAVELKDPDAACLTLALNRGWPLATDDGKILRVARDYGAATITTPALLKQWAESGKVGTEVVAQAARNVEDLANYRPKAGSVLHAWWSDLVATTDS